MSARSLLRALVLATLGSLALPAAGLAASITFTFTSIPTEFYVGGHLPTIELQLSGRSVSGGWGGGSGLQKAARLQELLLGKQLADNTFFPNMMISTAPVLLPNGQPDPAKGQLILSGLAKGTTGFFQEHIHPIDVKKWHQDRGMPVTGERQDNVRTLGKDPTGIIGFNDPLGFDACDGSGNFNTFTGGIVTDIGPLVFTFFANQFLTSPSCSQVVYGSDIITALYNSMSPSIGSYGVQILNYTSGDTSLTFFFDPNQTGLSQVDFGTTAAADGVFGSMTAAADVPEPTSLLLLVSGAAMLLRKKALPRR
jgi:hypothetical protein